MCAFLGAAGSSGPGMFLAVFFSESAMSGAPQTRTPKRPLGTIGVGTFPKVKRRLISNSPLLLVLGHSPRVVFTEGREGEGEREW